MNVHGGKGRENRKQPPHFIGINCHTSLCRPPVLAGLVKEDCTSCIAFAGKNIVIHYNANVIKAVVPHHFFMTGGKGQFDEAVVIGIGRIITPAAFPVYPAHGQH